MESSAFHELSDFLADAGVVRSAQLGCLVLIRWLPLVAFTPVLGGQAVPGRLRFAVAAILALTLMPVLTAGAAEPAPAGVFALLMAKEALVGLTLAMIVLVIFEGFAACGAIIDFARGQGTTMAFDPHVSQQESAAGQFLSRFAVALLLTLGGHRLLIEALGRSFISLPPQGTLPAGWLGVDPAARTIALGSHLFSTAFRLASPVLLVMLLLDVALGLINRFAPQIQVFFLSMTVKGTIGLLVLLLVFGLLVVQMEQEFAWMLDAIARIVAG